MASDDRRVHATTAESAEIVRYDRAGKWYVERPDGTRRQLTVQEAVSLATAPGARRYPGQHGGERFDHLVRKTQCEHA